MASSMRTVARWVLLLTAWTAALAAAPPRYTRGVVVSEQSLASEAGLDVLRRGGNAVDAAVAVGYALAVTDPCCGNLGGGGFMLIHLAKTGADHFIDFRERAPLRATRDMYLDAHGNVVPELSTRGYLSVGVPGTVAGLEYARAAYGTMAAADLIAPAYDLARNGFTLSDDDARVLGDDEIPQRPDTRALFTQGGRPLRAGTTLRQTELAATLKLLMDNGPRSFYTGPIAQRIVAASTAHGGILALDDFAQYTVVEREPIACRYREFRIISAPPPSSGGVTLCEMLGMLQTVPFAALGPGTAEGTHDVIEAERLAFVDRNTYLGDPDFVHDPISQLLDPAYIARQRARIGERALRSADLAPGLALHEGMHTTHYSIVDRFGNAVAVTYTINDGFGSYVAAPHTGFLLNDEMDDFTSKPGVANMFGLVQGAANEIAPGKRPLSSMTPTIALRDGRVAIVAGSPGGPTIITTVLQVLMNVIDFGMTPQQAVDAPRFHEQWQPEPVMLEDNAFSPALTAALLALGYTFRDARAESGEWGSAQVIAIDPLTGTMLGGSDRRRPGGGVAGY
jgi:gamma-glutamyltranspeptidase/glutathione hydrolase